MNWDPGLPQRIWEASGLPPAACPVRHPAAPTWRVCCERAGHEGQHVWVGTVPPSEQIRLRVDEFGVTHEQIEADRGDAWDLGRARPVHGVTHEELVAAALYPAALARARPGDIVELRGPAPPGWASHAPRIEPGMVFRLEPGEGMIPPGGRGAAMTVPLACHPTSAGTSQPVHGCRPGCGVDGDDLPWQAEPEVVAAARRGARVGTIAVLAFVALLGIAAAARGIGSAVLDLVSPLPSLAEPDALGIGAITSYAHGEILVISSGTPLAWPETPGHRWDYGDPGIVGEALRAGR